MTDSHKHPNFYLFELLIWFQLKISLTQTNSVRTHSSDQAVSVNSTKYHLNTSTLHCLHLQGQVQSLTTSQIALNIKSPESSSTLPAPCTVISITEIVELTLPQVYTNTCVSILSGVRTTFLSSFICVTFLKMQSTIIYVRRLF